MKGIIGTDITTQEDKYMIYTFKKKRPKLSKHTHGPTLAKIMAFISITFVFN